MSKTRWWECIGHNGLVTHGFMTTKQYTAEQCRRDGYTVTEMIHADKVTKLVEAVRELLERIWEQDVEHGMEEEITQVVDAIATYREDV